MEREWGKGGEFYLLYGVVATCNFDHLMYPSSVGRCLSGILSNVLLSWQYDDKSISFPIVVLPPSSLGLSLSIRKWCTSDLFHWEVMVLPSEALCYCLKYLFSPLLTPACLHTHWQREAVRMHHHQNVTVNDLSMVGHKVIFFLLFMVLNISLISVDAFSLREKQINPFRLVGFQSVFQGFANAHNSLC